MEDINQLKQRVNLLEYIKEQYSLGKETKSYERTYTNRF